MSTLNLAQLNMDTVLIVILGVSVVAVWAWARIQVSAAIASLFRYKLWSLRDRIYDAIHDERLARLEAADRLLDACENMIRVANDVKMGSWLVRPKLPETVTTEIVSTRKQYEKYASKEQAELLKAFDTELQRAVFTHLVFGSPTGWLIFFVFTAKFCFGAVLRKGLSICTVSLSSASSRLFEVGASRMVPDEKTWRTSQQIRSSLHSSNGMATFAA
jgi:hypothetical protein